MFANRFTALLDACVLARALPRNLLLSLAAADFFRPRWTARILDETERAIAKMKIAKGVSEGAARADAARARRAMEDAFEHAIVTDYQHLESAFHLAPDHNDRHVMAAAARSAAQTIVTDNLKDFPGELLFACDMEAKSADDFIADTIDLDSQRAYDAIRSMRLRFQNPAFSPPMLVERAERSGLPLTAELLRLAVKAI